MTFLELEKLCKKRKFFYYFKIFLLFFILIIIGIVTYYFINTKSSKKTFVYSKEDKNKTKIEKKTIKTVKNTNQKEKLNLILDLNFSSNIPIKPKKTIELNKTKSKNKKTFVLESEVLPSYQTCINLAEKYYKEGKYKLALKWAKNANIQNNKDPESWIVTAKSLYKLGDKKHAIKILKIYYNYHNDEKVKKLLRDLNENNKK